MIRGAPQEFETSLGDYKQVNGVYLPFSSESGPKGSSSTTVRKSRTTKSKPSPLDDQRFVRPGGGPPMNVLLLLLIAQQPTAAAAVKVDSETISGLGAAPTSARQR